MSVGIGTFTPSELAEGHYRPIGGSYGSIEESVEALERHFKNKHGGSGTFRLYKLAESTGLDAIVEVLAPDGDPRRLRAIYKVTEDRR